MEGTKHRVLPLYAISMLIGPRSAITDYRQLESSVYHYSNHYPLQVKLDHLEQVLFRISACL